MPPSGMLCRVAFVSTDVSEERSASIIRATRKDEIGTLAINYQLTHSAKKYYCHPDGGGAKYLRNVGSYKSHKA
jgi:hypothetical protein